MKKILLLLMATIGISNSALSTEEYEVDFLNIKQVGHSDGFNKENKFRGYNIYNVDYMVNGITFKGIFTTEENIKVAYVTFFQQEDKENIEKENLQKLKENNIDITTLKNIIIEKINKKLKTYKNVYDFPNYNKKSY